VNINEAHACLDAALSTWRTDPKPSNAPKHIEAALWATGELQRALILCRLRYDNPQPRKNATMAKKKPVKKPANHRAAEPPREGRDSTTRGIKP